MTMRSRPEPRSKGRRITNRATQVPHGIGVLMQCVQGSDSFMKVPVLVENSKHSTEETPGLRVFVCSQVRLKWFLGGGENNFAGDFPKCFTPWSPVGRSALFQQGYPLRGEASLLSVFESGPVKGLS